MSQAQWAATRGQASWQTEQQAEIKCAYHSHGATARNKALHISTSMLNPFQLQDTSNQSPPNRKSERHGDANATKRRKSCDLRTGTTKACCKSYKSHILSLPLQHGNFCHLRPIATHLVTHADPGPGTIFLNRMEATHTLVTSQFFPGLFWRTAIQRNRWAENSNGSEPHKVGISVPLIDHLEVFRGWEPQFSSIQEPGLQIPTPPIQTSDLKQVGWMPPPCHGHLESILQPGTLTNHYPK